MKVGATQVEQDRRESPQEALTVSTGSAKYDHYEVRCESMADWDCENLCSGTPRTCCVCAEHDCEEARAERAKHPKRISP